MHTVISIMLFNFNFEFSRSLVYSSECPSCRMNTFEGDLFPNRILMNIVNDFCVIRNPLLSLVKKMGLVSNTEPVLESIDQPTIDVPSSSSNDACPLKVACPVCSLPLNPKYLNLHLDRCESCFQF